MWQPLMWPIEETAAKIANANENEIVDRPAVPSMPVWPAPAVRNTVSGTDPAPMKTRIAVPMASAVSFCDRVGDDIRSTSSGVGASAGWADVWGQFCFESGERRVGIGTVGREGDLGRRSDRQPE